MVWWPASHLIKFNRFLMIFCKNYKLNKTITSFFCFFSCFPLLCLFLDRHLKYIALLIIFFLPQRKQFKVMNETKLLKPVLRSVLKPICFFNLNFQWLLFTFIRVRQKFFSARATNLCASDVINFKLKVHKRKGTLFENKRYKITWNELIGRNAWHHTKHYH